jgi:uncharacterized protein YcfL
MPMKKYFFVAALAAALTSGLPSLTVAAEGGSIASKIEEQGAMKYLKVTGLQAARRDGLLKVQAEVSNTDNGNQQLYYRFKWLDQDGFTVWEEEPWKPLVIYGLQKKTISVVAPTFKATDFRLQLQSPDNAGKPNDNVPFQSN